MLSGYRTPQTNHGLEGAAKNSQHMRAMALDIHIPDVDNDAVAREVKSFIYGGTGMYPGRDFCPLRFWQLGRLTGSAPTRGQSARSFPSPPIRKISTAPRTAPSSSISAAEATSESVLEG